MSTQIAVRIPDAELQALDQAVESGSFGSRAEGVREALHRLLRELREEKIARQYRQAYSSQPLDPAIAGSSALLAAESIAAEEGGSQKDEAKDGAA